MSLRLGRAIKSLLLIMVSVTGLRPMPGSGRRWPEIVPVRRTFSFSDVDRDSIALYLNGPQGKPLYWLGCHSTDFAGKPSDPFHDDEDDYYAMFDCHLHWLKDKDGYNLLSYDAADPRENFSRALTTSEDIEGRCADYPDWGLVRHIRVRGMRITLEFKDVELGKEPSPLWAGDPSAKEVKSFKLDLSIEPDERARSAFAEPPTYANPHWSQPGSTKPLSADCSKLIIFLDFR